ncbi:hypothetical protein KPL71_027776 [Citrus sinensis]|uniref:Uncharacterized protein n=1 Tax=Citrus sinensis TaxID=2711 RepID=A0ACB8I9J1_CITSI|nr:hypothetical protein KPL71_027776 [Citrus sinensis]
MSGQASTKTRTGFSIFGNTIRFMEITQAFGGCLWGSFDERIRISLLNPFSGTDILQPGAGNCCHKLALSGNSDEESCVYILLNLKSAKFALWNKQIQNWCECEIEGEDDDNPFVDVISFNGCFCLLTKYYDVHVVDIKTACSKAKRIRINLNAHGENIHVLRYLVELYSEILIVCRFLNGDHFFLQKDQGVGTGNCIYFTNEYEPLHHNERDTKRRKGAEIEDWRIFGLSTDNPENFHGCGEMCNWPPIWLTAP